MDSKKRAAIKKVANHVKPTIMIGAEGLHKNIFDSIDNGFNTNEVLKIKVSRVDKSDKEITRKYANEIESKNACDVVAVIGTTIIVYKESKNKDKRMF